MDTHLSQPLETFIRVTPGTRPPRQGYYWQYTLTIAAALVILALLGGILIEMVNDPIDGYPAVSLQIDTSTCETGLDYMAQGESAISSGDYEAAIAAYTCALIIDPENYTAYLWRGTLAGTKGDYDQMGYDLYTFSSHQVAGTDPATRPGPLLKPTLDAAIEVRPDDPTLYMLRAMGAFTSTVSSGFEDFEHLMEIAPDNAVGYLYYWLMKPSPSTIQSIEFQTAMQLAPDSALLDWFIAFYVNQQNTDFVLEYLNRAIEDNPDHPFAYANRGFVHISQGDMAAAASDFRQHIQINQTAVVEGEPLPTDNTYIFDAVSGVTYQFPFTVQAGQTLNIIVSRDNTDITAVYAPVVVILDPEGNLIAAPYETENFYSGGGSARTPMRDFQMAESGEYTLILTANSTGSMEIRMVERN